MTIVSNVILHGATSWSVSLESSIMLLEVSLTLLENSAGFTYNCHLQSSFMIVKHLYYRPLVFWKQDIYLFVPQISMIEKQIGPP